MTSNSSFLLFEIQKPLPVSLKILIGKNLALPFSTTFTPNFPDLLRVTIDDGIKNESTGLRLNSISPDIPASILLFLLEELLI